MSSPTRTRITTSPGVELDVIQSGDPAGVPLLLLHGLSDSNASMRVLMDELPPGILIAVAVQASEKRMPGFGGVGHPREMI